LIATAIGIDHERHAQPWIVPAADAGCHETAPGDYRPLAERWRSMWPEFFPQK
jgi:hypothetical protein